MPAGGMHSAESADGRSAAARACKRRRRHAAIRSGGSSRCGHGRSFRHGPSPVPDRGAVDEGPLCGRRHGQQGDLLFEIDKRPYIDAQRQAEASLANDTAQLLHRPKPTWRTTRAQAKYAEADADRFGQLAKEGIVSHSQNEQYRSTADALRASIRADQAAMDSATRGHHKRRSRHRPGQAGSSATASPSRRSTGRAGNLLIQAGNLVKANGDNAVVVVNQVTPDLGELRVPEQHLDAIRQNSAAPQTSRGRLAARQSTQRARGELWP